MGGHLRWDGELCFGHSMDGVGTLISLICIDYQGNGFAHTGCYGLRNHIFMGVHLSSGGELFLDHGLNGEGTLIRLICTDYPGNGLSHICCYGVTQS